MLLNSTLKNGVSNLLFCCKKSQIMEEKEDGKSGGFLAFPLALI
jgi:hypothetical protein